MELKNYLAIFWRWGWIMVLCTLLAGVTSYVYTAAQPKVYQSKSRYLVGPVMDNPNVTSNDLRASGQIGQTYNELVTSRPTLQHVIDSLKLNTTPDALQLQVTGGFIETTSILTIKASAGDATVAANIANAVGDALLEQSPNNPNSEQVLRRQEAQSQIGRIQDTNNALQKEIDELAIKAQQATDATVQRGILVQLDDRRSRLADSQTAYNRLFDLLQGSNVNQIKLLEAAVPVTAPIAPNVKQNVLAAMIAGLVLGLAAMMLLEYFNDVIYTPEMLRKATGLNYLGGLARHKKLRGANGAQLVTIAGSQTLAAESFRILRANLQIAGTDRHLPSLLITSPSRGDGKSDVAANLAVALARTGKRVILIDANLRNPQIAGLFGLPDQAGLAHLMDADHMPELLAVPAVPGLSILPAGGMAANSSEILSSQHMYGLIQECKAQADVVLVDSPPLYYSDALALAPQVDGVLLVVSSGSTGRENTINAIESLRLVGARVIGTVLNRVKVSPTYFYNPNQTTNRATLVDSSATEARRSLSITNGSARARSLLDHARSVPASDVTVTSGMVEPTPADGGVSGPAAHISGDQPSLRSAATFDATAPNAADASANAADQEWSRALGEPVGAYSPADQRIQASEPAAVQTNGHRSAARRQNKNNH